VTGTGIELRTCTDADVETVLHVDELAFYYSNDRERTAQQAVPVELDRTLLARLDGEPVGLTSAYTFELSVPGGSQPTAGVTWVGVVPTARRRGVLTSLMDEQLRDVHDRGEHVAALYASEPAIYGRFGYGIASRETSLTVRRGDGILDGPSTDHLRAHTRTGPESREAVAEVYAAVRAERAGMPTVDDRSWARRIEDLPQERGGGSDLRVLVVTTADGTPRAYAMYSGKDDWTRGYPDNSIRVRETLAADTAAATMLWRQLLGLDLVSSVDIRRLPVDDVLLHLLRDPRRATPRTVDALHVRLVDVAGALAGRTYDVPWEGVVRVVDAHAPWNDGSWRLVLGPDDLVVERTDGAPDLVTDVAELGGAYLGDGALVARARAGRLEERTPGAVAGLDRALRHAPAPFCPYGF
jgi:predicted acetyltransferase